MSRSVQRRLAVQERNSGADLQPPVLPRHEEVDLLLKQSVKRLELGFMDFLELADEAIQGKFHERFGFQDASEYFDQRIGFSYRTLCRRMAVLAALRGLPPGQMPAAREALAELGSHKSSILAPAFAKEPADWQEWVDLARGATEEALQDAVSSALGHKARGRIQPGDAFWNYIVAHTPPERHEQILWVVKKVMEVGDTRNGIAVFLYMVDIMERELGAHGVVRDG